MKNEDDTFLKLKRVPWHILQEKIDNLLNSEIYEITNSMEKSCQFLESNGWSLEDYTLEYNRRYEAK